MRQHYFTTHAKDRFKERILKNNDPDWYKLLLEDFNSAKIDKSFLNNSTMMLHLGETYGYDAKREFRVSSKAVYIIDPKNNTVITIIPKADSKFSGRTSRFGK